MKQEKNIVYVPMAVDILHPGHLNIIHVAEGLGEVVVGLFTDEAIASYKRLPFMNYEQRKMVIENIKGVSRVVKQETPDYEPNLRLYKPGYMVHGTDWREGPLAEVRAKAIATMAEWGGKVVEPEYTKGISSTAAHSQIKESGTTPQVRLEKLRKLFNVKNYVKIIGAQDGQSALLIENLTVKEPGKPTEEYDVFWLGEQAEAVKHGKKSIVELDFSDRLKTVNEILDITTKPLIYETSDINDNQMLVRTVKAIERLGISALVLSETDEIGKCCGLIREGKATQLTKEFMIFVKLEETLMQSTEARIINRINTYREAGCDGIVLRINHKNKNETAISYLDDKLQDFNIPIIELMDVNSACSENKVEVRSRRAVVYENVLLAEAHAAMKAAAEKGLREW